MFMQSQPLAVPAEDVVPLSQPFLNGRELELVAEVLQSGRLSDGPMRARFEQDFAQFVGARYAVALSSGAAALRVAALGADWHAGDEVVMSLLASPAAVDAVRRTGATVTFADVDERTLTLSPAAVEAVLCDRTAGVIASDTFGWPADLATFDTIARVHGLTVIEDASEAFGAVRDGHGVGGSTWPVVFAFDGDRQLAIGEGGMLCTDDEALAQAWRARTDHVRMSDVSCAIGVAQLEKAPRSLAMREHVAAEYARSLADVPGVSVLDATRGGDVRSWYGYRVVLDEDVDVAHVVASIEARGVECATVTAVDESAGDCPVARSVASRSIALPLSPHLSPQQQHRVVAALRDALAAG
jgi:perosamine synthetase